MINPDEVDKLVQDLKAARVKKGSLQQEADRRWAAFRSQDPVQKEYWAADHEVRELEERLGKAVSVEVFKAVQPVLERVREHYRLEKDGTIWQAAVRRLRQELRDLDED